jgi:tetratricopeptide (TPR) repeat protein
MCNQNMARQKFLNRLRGWSDAFMTITEVILVKMGLYRLTRCVVEWHYAAPAFRPGARELELARILERTGKTTEAEEQYQRAIQPGKVFGYLFLGDFYQRQHQADSAIRTFEKALTLASADPGLVKQLEERLRALRQRESRPTE